MGIQGSEMQLNATDIIMILLGVIQAWFFYDKSKTDQQIKDLNDGIKAMVAVIHKIENDLSVARYALFEEKLRGRNSSDD